MVEQNGTITLNPVEPGNHLITITVNDGTSDMSTVNTTGDTEYVYEVSYANPVNDALTITPGIAIVDAQAGESTYAAVKASFSF